MGIFAKRLRCALGVLLGVPCVVARTVEVNQGGLRLTGRNGLVQGVQFRDLRAAVTLRH
jgi:hypothetical protein